MVAVDQSESGCSFVSDLLLFLVGFKNSLSSMICSFTVVSLGVCFFLFFFLKIYTSWNLLNLNLYIHINVQPSPFISRTSLIFPKWNFIHQILTHFLPHQIYQSRFDYSPISVASRIQLIREGQPGSDSYFTQDLAKKLVKMKIPGLVLRYSDSIGLRSAEESEFSLRSPREFLSTRSWTHCWNDKLKKLKIGFES